jgi:hypothetical protein
MDINVNSIKNAVGDISKIIEDGRSHAKKQYKFNSFKARNETFRFAAIDGSNHNIRGVNFLFSTIRAGYQIFENGKLMEASIDPVLVEFIANNNDPKVGYINKYEGYYQEIVRNLPEKYPDFEKTPERIRTLLEWGKLVELIDYLGEDDIIVFDGALISGTITTNHHFFNGLANKAKDKGITLVGLSKDTSLSIDSAPVPIVLLESSQQHHPNKNWYVEYKPGTYFVRFTKLIEQVFRLDAVIPGHLNIDTILARISSYCFDDATLGYPFPMQAIHDAVRIDERQREECFAIFKQEYLKKGLPEKLFNDMFNIYHDRLDTISFGR